MKQEYSYGAVVYQKNKDQVLVLLERMVQGHVSLPKGHIEEGETPVECAVREIKEETNLDVDIDTSFSHTISYQPGTNIKKDVTFFLATPKSQILLPQLKEVSSLEWVDGKKAIDLLTFKSDKDTLSLALKAIEAK